MAFIVNSNFGVGVMKEILYWLDRWLAMKIENELKWIGLMAIVKQSKEIFIIMASLSSDATSSFNYCEDMFIFKSVRPGELSNFDRRLQDKWNCYMARGLFKYSLSRPETRKLAGKFGYLAQLQLNRVSLRRQPQSITSLKQPFDQDQFNFTKINEDNELIFQLKAKEAHESPDLGRDLLITNVSPLEYGHCLLVPQVDKGLPQVLTSYSTRLALQLLVLSSNPEGGRVDHHGAQAIRDGLS